MTDYLSHSALLLKASSVQLSFGFKYLNSSNKAVKIIWAIV